MTTNRNRSEAHDAERLSHGAWGERGELVVLTVGHVPDETDPAWPSKSGQAD